MQKITVARLRFCVMALLALLVLVPCRAQAMSSHPRAARNSSTTKPSPRHQVENFDPDVYHLGTPYKIVVGIDYDAVKQPVRVDWREAGRVHAQRLDMPLLSTGNNAPQVPDDPDDRKFWWTSDATSTDYTPVVFLWKGLANPTLIVMGDYPTAAYGIRAPLIFVLRNQRWQLIPNATYDLSFTNRGGFYVKGKRLYVWDYEMHPRQAHSDAQRYWLKVFSLRRGHLSQVEKRLTHGRYLKEVDFESGAPPRSLPPNKDPLREFGLRWHWWGQSAQ